jgi:hypothetical protein
LLLGLPEPDGLLLLPPALTLPLLTFGTSSLGLALPFAKPAVFGATKGASRVVRQ